jgi:hypothetical protein
MTARALVRSLGLLAVAAALGCEPPPEKEDPVAETMRMLKAGEKTVQSSGGTSANVLVRVERVRASAEDAASLAALWRYADGKLVISGRDGLAAGGVRLGVAGGNFQAQLAAWQGRAKQTEKTTEEIVVLAGHEGLLSVSRSALVPVLRVITPSGEVTVLQNVQVGAGLAVRPSFAEGGKIELELHPSFSTVSGAKGAESYSLDALSTRVTLTPGQKLVLGASTSAAQDSAATGLFGYDARGSRTATVITVTAERL